MAAKPEVVRFSASTWVGIALALGAPVSAMFISNAREIATLKADNSALAHRVSRIENLLDARSYP